MERVLLRCFHVVPATNVPFIKIESTCKSLQSIHGHRNIGEELIGSDEDFNLKDKTNRLMTPHV